MRRRAKRREGLIAGRKVMGRYTMAVFPCHVVTELQPREKLIWVEIDGLPEIGDEINDK